MEGTHWAADYDALLLSEHTIDRRSGKAVQQTGELLAKRGGWCFRCSFTRSWHGKGCEGTRRGAELQLNLGDLSCSK